MLGCQYKLKLQGETLEFATIEELNDFIQNNYQRIKASLQGGPISFSKNLDPKAETTAIIEKLALGKKDLKIEIDADGNKKVTGIKAGYRGATKYIDSLEMPDGKPVIKPFDMKGLINRKTEEIRNDLVSQGKDLAEATNTATEEVQALVDSYEAIRDNGTDIHKLSEMYFETQYDNAADLLEAFLLASPDTRITTENVEVLFENLKTFRDKLRETHDDPDLQFFTEIPVYYDSLEESEKVMGVLDLVVVDSEGKAHIYDYKTSSKRIPEWDRDKMTRYAYQLTIYKQLLRQQGMNVESVNLLPLYLDTDIKTGEVTQISVDEPLDLTPQLHQSNAYAKIRYDMEKAFPVSFENHQFQTEGDVMETYKAFFSDLKVDFNKELNDFIATQVKTDNGKRYYKDGRKKMPLSSDDKQMQEEILNVLGKRNENLSGIVGSIKRNVKDFIREGVYTNPMHSYNITNPKNDAESSAKYAFSKYADKNWEVVTFDELERQGVITFRNKISDIYDFLMLTEENLLEVKKLKKGTTIKGNFYTDHQVGKNNGLIPADNLHINGIKVLAFMNNNPSLFSGNASLGMIRAYDHKNYKVEGINHEPLISAFGDLAAKVGLENNFKEINRARPQDTLYQEVKSALAGPKEKLNNTNRDTIEKIETVLNSNETSATIIRKLAEIQKTAFSRWFNRDVKGITPDTDLGKIYLWLNATIKQMSGRPTMFESEDMVLMGLSNSVRWNTKDEMSSNSVKEALSPLRQASDALRQSYTKLNGEIRKTFQEFYSAQGTSDLIGDHILKFGNLFERNPDKTLRADFKFKDPELNKGDDTYLNHAERKLLNELLPKMYEYLHFETPMTESLIEAAKDDGTFYNIPLARASSTSKTLTGAFTGNTKSDLFGPLKGVRQSTKDWAMEAFNQNNIFDEQRSESEAMSNDMLEVYNKFNISKSETDRNDYLNTRPISDFETNIEQLFGDLAHTALRKRIFDKTLPIVHATMISSYLYNSGYTNKSLDNMHQYIQEYVKTTVFEEKLMEPHQMKSFETAAKVKHIITMAQLSLAPLNLVRETMQGQFTNYVRIWAKQYGEKATPSVADYNKALKIMIGDGLSEQYMKDVTIVEELNHMYGMAGMDINRLPEQMRLSRKGISQFSSRWMLWFQGAPDYINRMSFFVAKMLKDGSYNAHSYEDGILKYDWTKDERFDVYAAGKTDDPKYNFQKAIYNAIREDLNGDTLATGEGTVIEEGDALPRAYSTKERDSVKAFINYSHGSYDHGDGILFKDTLVGVMLMQFRTWMIAKKQQMYTKSGDYVMGEYTQLKNDDGELMYYDADGNKTSDPGVNNMPIVEWKGRYMEGIWQSFRRTLSILNDGDLSLHDRFAMIKGDDVIGGNMKMAAADFGIFFLLGFLLKGIIDWDDLEEDDRVLGAILSTAVYASNDLNLWNNITGMADPESLFPAINTVVKNINTSIGVVFKDEGSFSTIITNSTAIGRTLQKTTTLFDD